MKAIINAELILHDHFMPDAAVFFDNGVITDICSMEKATIPENCEIIDAKGEYLGPGLIDIHTHCGDKVRFTENVEYPALAHLKHGVTTVLPAVSYELKKEEQIAAINLIKEGMKNSPNVAGIYMEGPYLNAKYGANKDQMFWVGPTKSEDYIDIVNAGKDVVKVWCVAPETENIEAFVKYAKSQNPNVKFAVAHSEATPQQIEKLMKYGLCIGTHHTNSTGTIINYSECRGVCVDECVNYNREIYAELICDSRGIHVDPYMLRLVRRIKGDDRVILISDQSKNDGPTPPGFEGVTDLWFDNAGEISGSKLYADIACRNMMKHTGASLVNVFNFASYNPATAVGFTDRGEIEIGKRADFVICDYKVNIKKVILGGDVQNFD